MAGDKKLNILFKDVIRNKYGYYEFKNREEGVEEDISAHYAEAYYQNELSTYKKEYTDRELKNKYNRLQRIQQVLEKRLSIKTQEKKFLDIGCGEGFALKYFMEHGYEVSGIEYDTYGCKFHNPEMVGKIRKGSAYDVLESFLPESYLGTVLMDNVLEHVVDPEKLIRKVTEVSKAGTCLIITVPNDFSDTQLELFRKGYIDNAFWVTAASYPPEHLSYFSKNALESLLEAYGWRMAFVMGSYPIDFNLFNNSTNYIKNKETGRNCYQAMIEIEEFMNGMEQGTDILIDIYGKLGEAGVGRNITAFFILQ